MENQNHRTEGGQRGLPLVGSARQRLGPGKRSPPRMRKRTLPSKETLAARTTGAVQQPQVLAAARWPVLRWPSMAGFEVTTEAGGDCSTAKSSNAP